MIKYDTMREDWIALRKDKKNLLDVQVKQLNIYGLLIDKISKMAKMDQSGEYDDYMLKAIKSELKQWLDAKNQGVLADVEIMILKDLLPKDLTDEEISGHVIAIIARYEDPKMKDVMADLKGISGMNMQVANKYVRELL